ncbi:hypothetical protein BKA62DRAFT_829531 [Auriculariales sp. MPI-PUGE-AT-0066]|nr:hypothetical protein BKA62DRAFT_829531 [Auriculariales sp. MPI-PUGE-AT-0066]
MTEETPHRRRKQWETGGGSTAQATHANNGVHMAHIHFTDYFTQAQALDRKDSDRQLFEALYAAAAAVKIKEDSLHDLLQKLSKTAASDGAQQTNLYDPVDQILNSISFAMRERFDSFKLQKVDLFTKSVFNGWSCDQLPVWVRYDRKAPNGDFLDGQVKPDHTALILDKAHGPPLGADKEHHSLHPSSLAWQDLISVGEVADKPDNTYGQLKTYMDMLSRYRPDIATVHGFHVLSKETKGGGPSLVHFFSANARGMYISDRCEINDLRAWCTHVFLVYHAHVTRLSGLTKSLINMGTTSKQVVFHHLDLRFEDDSRDTKVTFAPFFAKPLVGSMTFVGLAIAQDLASRADLSDESLKRRWKSKDGIGIVKLAFSRCPTESDLVRPETRLEHREADCYDLAHKDRRLDGLARHRRVKLTNPPRARNPTKSEQEEPDVEMRGLFLESIGLPLNECETWAEALMVMYDVLETLEELYEKNVKHRDISFRNILIRPTHVTVEGLSEPTTKRSIEWALLRGVDHDFPDDILERLGQAARRRCLLTDLDGAITDKQQDMQQRTRGLERTGTAMFMALDYSAQPSRTWTDPPTHLLRQVFAGGELFYPRVMEVAFDPTLRGFEQGDPRYSLYDANIFKATLKHTVAQVNEFTQDEDLHLENTCAHVPRFDAESCFWVFSYYLARSRPHDDTTLAGDRLYKYVQDRLSETGADANRQRLNENLVHPTFTALVPFFRRMEYYLLDVPWHKLEEAKFDIHPSHAFVALRRIILACLLSTDDNVQHALSARLANVPREYNLPAGYVNSRSSNLRNTYANGFGLNTQSTHASNDSAKTTLGKRKAEEDLNQTNRPTKQGKTNTPQDFKLRAVIDVLQHTPPKTCRDRMSTAMSASRWMQHSGDRETETRS